MANFIRTITRRMIGMTWAKLMTAKSLGGGLQRFKRKFGKK